MGTDWRTDRVTFAKKTLLFYIIWNRNNFYAETFAETQAIVEILTLTLNICHIFCFLVEVWNTFWSTMGTKKVGFEKNIFKVIVKNAQNENILSELRLLFVFTAWFTESNK